MSNNSRRRQVLQVCATGLTVGVAGCTDGIVGDGIRKSLFSGNETVTTTPTAKLTPTAQPAGGLGAKSDSASDETPGVDPLTLTPTTPASAATPTPTQSSDSTVSETSDETPVTTPAPAKLTALGGDSGDLFGKSVALNDGTALVGAPHDEDPNGDEAGAAYLFEWTGNGWTQQAKFTPTDGDSEDKFGWSVAMTDEMILVGAPKDEHPNGKGAGAVYVFERPDGTWRQHAKLAPGASDIGDLFGLALALDGSQAIVGAPTEDKGQDAFSKGPGAAYVFRRRNDDWTLDSTLRAADGDSEDFFGVSVALDGETALVGAYREEDPNGSDAGASYVFQQTDSEWHQQAKLLPADGDSKDRFGASVSLDDSTALIGVAPEKNANKTETGAAYVFERTATAWRQQVKLEPTAGDHGDGFGWPVVLRDDIAIVGATRDDDPNGTDAGSTYVFERTAGSWQQEEKLVPADGDAGERFGNAIGVDEGTVLVGARRDDGADGTNRGSAYVFLL